MSLLNKLKNNTFKDFLTLKNIYILWFLLEFNIGIFWSIWSVNVVDQGHTYAKATLALALYLFIIGILETPTGYLADKYGHKKLSIIGIFISSYGLFSLSLASSTIVLYSSLGLAALGMSILNGSKQVWFIDAAKFFNPVITKDQLLINLEIPRRLAQITGAYIGTGLNQINPSFTWYSIGISGLIAIITALKTPSGRSGPIIIKNLIEKSANGPFISIKKTGLILVYMASFFYGVDLAIRGLILSPFVIKILNNGNSLSMGTVTMTGAIMGLLGNKCYKFIMKKKEIDKTIFMVITLIVYSFSETVFYHTNSFLTFLILYGICIFTMGWFVSLHDAIVLDFINEKERAIHLSTASMLRNISASIILILLAPYTKELSVIRSYWRYAAFALMLCACIYQILYILRKSASSQNMRNKIIYEV